MATDKRGEIEGNLKRFLQLLPELLPKHDGDFVLIRHGEIVDFFTSALNAQIEGNERFPDELFSIQQVNELPSELGYFSYALHNGMA